MMRDELLQRIAALPEDSDVGVQIGDDHLDITDVIPWGDARGRQPRDDKAFAGLAVEYSFLVQDGDRTPAKTLAGRHGGASGTWANRIAEARKRGMLTGVKPGEAGGGLTDKALETLHPGWSPEDDALIDAELSEGE